MNEEIDSMAQILDSCAGLHDSIVNYREGEKVKAEVLGKSITDVDEIVQSNSFLFLKCWMNNLLPFLELPLHKF